MNLWEVNMRRTSRKVFINRMVFVAPPARKKSCDACDEMMVGLAAWPAEVPGEEPRLLSPALMLRVWATLCVMETDRGSGLSRAPRRKSGSPRTLWRVGHTGRTYCFRAWWKGVSVFRSPKTCLKRDDSSLSSGPKAVRRAVSNLAVAQYPLRLASARTD